MLARKSRVTKTKKDPNVPENDSKTAKFRNIGRKGVKCFPDSPNIALKVGKKSSQKL
jgi:hypothetical protein